MGLSGKANPNWKGGAVVRSCFTCGSAFSVKPGRAHAKFCSMTCVGAAQRGVSRPVRRRVIKHCAICGDEFAIYRSHAHRSECCSRRCAGALRARRQAGPGNANWRGGLSRLPYPWNFRFISRTIIERDGSCLGPACAGDDDRLTAHHIDYDKANCDPSNLITLCSACNSKANFDRPRWQKIYSEIIYARAKKRGGGWDVETF